MEKTSDARGHLMLAKRRAVEVTRVATSKFLRFWLHICMLSTIGI